MYRILLCILLLSTALALSLSGLKADASFDSRTTVSGKYTQRTVQQVLGQLGM